MKTIKEESELIRKNSLFLLGVSKSIDYVTCADREQLAFEKGVKFTQRWIPIEEDLPETNEFEESKICLVKNKYRIDIGRYYSCQKRWWPADMEVTHWRPLERQ